MKLGEYLKRFSSNNAFISTNFIVTLENKAGELVRLDNDDVLAHKYDECELTQVSFNDLYVRHELRIKE